MQSLILLIVTIVAIRFIVKVLQQPKKIKHPARVSTRYMSTEDEREYMSEEEEEEYYKNLRSHRQSQIDVDVSMYRKRHQLMNNSESSFFYEALKVLPEGYCIFPKMRIADIIETKDGHGYYYHRNKILPKHVDFVICDKNLRPICAVEIDGKSHDTDKMRDRDELVEHIFEYVGIPLERVKVGDDFNKICNELKQCLTT